ncbi:GNAT family N-acetyltransferase [Rathayibacter festucae]|uniref:GNAT family N-acetyltransferase n=1 Tax=Rathayibacter festucae TaxID=110937 RepID=UPI001FB30833|nr:GNAT family N-acetyltransferase [Rathayibacter festucae]MCJ1698423.1 GNAT family N-acetyltransferase [Rathayibacter festucae]
MDGGDDQRDGAEPSPVESTERLLLQRPAETDLDDLFALYSDPRLAEGDPLLVHPSRAHTRAVLDRRREQWARDGLSSWVVRERSPRGGPGLIGVGGCSLLAGTAWNVAFTLHPDRWGKGYAQEIATAGIAQATLLRPELPITAVVAERNRRSHRAVERLGLVRAWSGPDAHSPDPTARVVLYADRPLSVEQIGLLTS